jgi:hypothetical protein
MNAEITQWTALAAILAFGACGLWTWILLEGIEVMSDPHTAVARRMRLAGATTCCTLMLAGAYFSWMHQPGIQAVRSPVTMDRDVR